MQLSEIKELVGTTFQVVTDYREVVEFQSEEFYHLNHYTQYVVYKAVEVLGNRYDQGMTRDEAQDEARRQTIQAIQGDIEVLESILQKNDRAVIRKWFPKNLRAAAEVRKLVEDLKNAVDRLYGTVPTVEYMKEDGYRIAGGEAMSVGTPIFLTRSNLNRLDEFGITETVIERIEATEWEGRVRLSYYLENGASIQMMGMGEHEGMRTSLYGEEWHVSREEAEAEMDRAARAIQAKIYPFIKA